MRKFVTLEPAKGSLGVYGVDGTVNNFIEAQAVGEYFEAITRYSVVARRLSRANRRDG